MFELARLTVKVFVALADVRRVAVLLVLDALWRVDASAMPRAVALALESIARQSNETLDASTSTVLACAVTLASGRALAIVAGDARPSDVAGAGEVDALQRKEMDGKRIKKHGEEMIRNVNPQKKEKEKEEKKR